QPLNDIERARVVIRNMRSLGAKVALDDAGTGHGGLAYLQQLGLDVIKIDKLFIDAIGTDSLSAPIVDSLISLAESLGMDIVAEGVEEPLQVEYLREKGVRMAQGYLFAKPLPGETYKRLIEKMMPLAKRPEERRKTRTRPAIGQAIPAV
ncbi:MAG: EAL domain-containing protein, partial [Hyphomicrobiales bacterium]